jgi:hypothetical protein
LVGGHKHFHWLNKLNVHGQENLNAVEWQLPSGGADKGPDGNPQRIQAGSVHKV